MPAVRLRAEQEQQENQPNPFQSCELSCDGTAGSQAVGPIDKADAGAAILPPGPCAEERRQSAGQRIGCDIRNVGPEVARQGARNRKTQAGTNIGDDARGLYGCADVQADEPE